MAVKKLKIEHHYDSEEDVLYISFADDEPTYTESIDDLLYIELGWFSGVPKGFRIMSPRANNIDIIGFVVKQLKQVVEHRRKELKQEEELFGSMLKQKLPEMLAAQT
ncbi:MAG: DUF2283 domain-containing protein [Sedimentisphaerales bacterium]|nr:DUF2283 domain-containing protein [Sedimentisphaerales bacterium]